MSLAGPRPHFSPLDTSSSSITPFDPRFTVTIPSKSCVAEGMNTPSHFFSAAGISAILRGDRHLPNPILQSLHRLIVPLRDYRFDVGKIVRRGGAIE